MSDDRSDRAALRRAKKCQIEIGECSDVRAIVTTLANFVEWYGFTTVGLGHMINPGQHAPDPSIVFQLSNWPKEWSSHWASSHLIMFDPIAKFAQMQSAPFRWNTAFADERTGNKKVERLMRDFGFKDGLAIPIQIDGPPGVVSLGADHCDIDHKDIPVLEMVCYMAYSRIESLYGSFPYQSVVQLTPQQTAVLHYAAVGKTNWEIGKILKISQHSVRDHIAAACERLNANGRTHAVARAIGLGLILR